MRRHLAPALVLTALLLGACSADGPVSPTGATRPSESETSWGPERPFFNLEALLRDVTGGSGFGHVKFRQPNDELLVIYLDTWVRGLAPNTAYALQRAVDLSPPDGQCGSESGWLTLGQGLVPQAIVTDETGTGRASLFRSVAAFPVGSEFDIHFRIVDDATKSVVVLQSECYRFTISQ